MTTERALDLALEALEGLKSIPGGRHELHELNAIHRKHDRAIAAIKQARSAPVQKPVATKDWEGAEYWMPLAWELCAEECGEDACNELIWEGGPIPEPWGDRWLKYEDEAKRLIALVQKHTTQPAQQDAKRYRYLYDLTCRVGVDSELVRRLTYNQAHLDALIEDTETARSSKENT
jgi:hypothetical protein